MAILRHPCRNFITLLIAAMLVCLPMGVFAQSEARLQLQENKIKAGLVYNLIKYTVWPASSAVVKNKRIAVCLLGGDPFAGSLNPLNGRTAQQYVIKIRNVGQIVDAMNCNVVIIHSDYEDNMRETLDIFGNEPMLTISDVNGFARDGGMAEISIRSDQRVHLTVNKDSLVQSGMMVDDRMLKLADVIGDR